MFNTALVIMALHGSTLVGSLSTPKVISVHLCALVVLHIAVRIQVRNLFMHFVDGSVHCVPCSILGITKVATPLAFKAWVVGHCEVLIAEAMA